MADADWCGLATVLIEKGEVTVASLVGNVGYAFSESFAGEISVRITGASRMQEGFANLEAFAAALSERRFWSSWASLRRTGARFRDLQ